MSVHAKGTVIALAVLVLGLAIMAFPAARDAVALASELSRHELVGNISYAGEEIPVIEYEGQEQAPAAQAAGRWFSAPGDDGFVYLVGHNPGPFDFVVGLTNGDKVFVSKALSEGESDGNKDDAEGKELVEYVVRDAFEVSRGTRIDDIESKIRGEQRRMVLQACCDESDGYRVVVLDRDH